MSSFNSVLPFALGTQLDATAGGYLDPLLGQLYKTFDTAGDERVFRLVKCGATALPINTCFISAASSGRKTWVVTGGLLPVSSQMAGVVPEEYTTAIAASSYFLAQVGGNALVVAGDTLFSALTGVESRLVAGSAASGAVRTVAAFTTASTSEEQGIFALASNTIAATAVGQTVRVLLRIALDN
jgi:hypothetical protein